jgi:predicted hydrocarbon binding protein
VNSYSEREGALIGGWMTTLGTLVKAIVDKYGEEGRNLAKKALKDLGKAAGREELENLKIESRSIEAFVQLMEPWDLVFKIKIKSKELTESENAITSIVHVSDCPLAKYWKTVNAPLEMCDIWYSFDQGVAEAVNPKMTFKIMKSLYKGDSYCERIVELEK